MGFNNTVKNLSSMFRGEEEMLEKAEQTLNLIERDDIQKGGPRAVVGEKRMFGGREYIRTMDGWKFHGKGTGKKAQEHAKGHQKVDLGHSIHKDAKEIAKHAGISDKEYEKLHPGTKEELAAGFHKESNPDSDFQKLNNQYKKLDKKLDSASESEGVEIGKQMEEIQQKMSKISAEIENKQSKKDTNSSDHLKEADAWAKELSNPTSKSKGMTVSQIDEKQAHHYRQHEKASKADQPYSKGDEVVVGKYKMTVSGYTEDGRVKVVNAQGEKFTLSEKQTKELDGKQSDLANKEASKNEGKLKEGDEGSFETKDGEKLSYRVYKDGGVKVEGSNVRKDFDTIGEAESFMASYKKEEQKPSTSQKTPVEILNSKNKQLAGIEEKLQDHIDGVSELSEGELKELRTKKEVISSVIKKLEAEVGSRKRSTPDNDKKAQAQAAKETAEEFKEEKEPEYDKPDKEEEEEVKKSEKENALEKADSSKVKCSECGWQWKLKDGGDDPYICHECGNDNSSKPISKSEEKGNDPLIKGGKAAVLGEKRMFGGREYIKTMSGWKFHGKGTGVKAQEHAKGHAEEKKISGDKAKDRDKLEGEINSFTEKLKKDGPNKAIQETLAKKQSELDSLQKEAMKEHVSSAKKEASKSSETPTKDSIKTKTEKLKEVMDKKENSSFSSKDFDDKVLTVPKSFSYSNETYRRGWLDGDEKALNNFLSQPEVKKLKTLSSEEFDQATRKEKQRIQSFPSAAFGSHPNDKSKELTKLSNEYTDLLKQLGIQKPTVKFSAEAASTFEFPKIRIANPTKALEILQKISKDFHVYPHNNYTSTYFRIAKK